MHDNQLNFDITKREICYLLGFFWADCYFGFCKSKSIFEFSFEIKSKDMAEISDMLYQMGFAKMKTRYRKNSTKELSNFRLSKQKSISFFENYKFHRKNEGCPIYFDLADEMKLFFIKGFLDGDGSISLDKNNLFRVGFNGSKHQSWDFLEDFCESYDIPFRIYKKDRKASHPSHTKDHSYSVFEFTTLQTRVKFCSLLPEIGLSRKLEIFKNFKMKRLEDQSKNSKLKTISF